jgi:hypothetical protein
MRQLSLICLIIASAAGVIYTCQSTPKINIAKVYTAYPTASFGDLYKH